MKKKIFMLVIMLFPLVLFGQMNTSRIGQVIYDPVLIEEQESFFSPLALGFNMYRVHMILAYGGEFEHFSSYQYARLIVSLQDIVTYNILDLLQFELDKGKVIDTYLSNLDRYLIESDMALANIKEEMSLLSYSMQNCLSQKSVSDKQYLDAIQYPYQQYLIEDSINSSKEYAKCASDAKIEYNAKKVLRDKISNYRSIISVKYNYLSNNRNDIVDHYDLMKNDMLDRLLEIKNMLNRYDL